MSVVTPPRINHTPFASIATPTHLVPTLEGGLSPLQQKPTDILEPGAIVSEPHLHVCWLPLVIVIPLP